MCVAVPLLLLLLQLCSTIASLACFPSVCLIKAFLYVFVRVCACVCNLALRLALLLVAAIVMAEAEAGREHGMRVASCSSRTVGTCAHWRQFMSVAVRIAQFVQLWASASFLLAFFTAPLRVRVRLG